MFSVDRHELSVSGSPNLENRTLMYETSTVTGVAFIRQIQRVTRIHGKEVHFETRPGKGSHGQLYYDGRFIAVKDRKKAIGPGLLRKMLADLGLKRDDIEES